MREKFSHIAWKKIKCESCEVWRLNVEFVINVAALGSINCLNESLNGTRFRFTHWDFFPIILDSNPKAFVDCVVLNGGFIYVVSITMSQLYQDIVLDFQIFIHMKYFCGPHVKPRSTDMLINFTIYIGWYTGKKSNQTRRLTTEPISNTLDGWVFFFFQSAIF